MKSRQLSQVDCNVICSTNAKLQIKCKAQEFTLAENVAAAARDFMLSKQTAFEAAAGDVVTTDTVGLLPVPVLGPVFENLNQQIRPVIAAVGARAYPDNGNQKTFIRPTWTTHTSVATQSSELAAVSATTPVIASNVISQIRREFSMKATKAFIHREGHVDMY